MKYLIVGGGSMGKRRIRCLLANGVSTEDLYLIDTRDDRRNEVREKYGVNGAEQLDAGMRWGPDAVVISVPGALHKTVLTAAIDAGKHAFCEVPLCTSLDGIDELIRLAARKNLQICPGVQSPLHPIWNKVKAWISDPAFGKPLIFHQMFGQYLPDWHPYEDYRRFYASDQAMGGGNLDVIAQELSALYWLMSGRARELFCRSKLLSSLEVKGFDCQQILAWTDDGMAMTLQFDLIQRKGTKVARVISEQGTVEYTTQYAKRYLAGFSDWEIFETPKDYQYEQCYIDEIKLFIDAIHGRSAWHNPVHTAVDVVRFLAAIAESHVKNATVKF
ncbi:MAG: Gfo/Idh/MocA family oxidoreductase [Pirellulales bacterium]|nr:Gfo/Idh/MocA family oxidoreductase [Pirellulales bacterium]